jgi:hypothetical protein
MFSNRPLFDTKADSPYYVETAERRRFVEALRRGQNALVIGDAGAGKTTLLQMTTRALRDETGARVAYVSLGEASDVGRAAVALVRAAYREGWLEAVDTDLEAAALAGTDPFAPTMLLRSLGSIPGRGVLLVDDVQSEPGHGLFGRLRDELWQLPFTWGVAIESDRSGALLTPPADAFFELRVTLDPLDRLARGKLLEKRNGYGADTLSATDIDRLATSGPGNPRQLITYARQVAEEPAASPHDLLGGAERRRELARARGGRPATMLVNELEGLGPVSASDERLLDRLGWTRPRATEVLNQLEQAGIVVSYSEPRDGRSGRPRKLYELRPAADFVTSHDE